MRMPLVIMSRCCHVSVSIAILFILHTQNILYATEAALLLRIIYFVLLITFGVIIDNGAFDLLDQVGDGDTTGTGIGAVEDGAATPDTITLTQDSQAFCPALVATIEDEAMRVHYRGRPHPVGVAPDGRTGTGTGTTEDAFGSLVVTGAFFSTLQPLRTRLAIIGDQVWLDGFVLVEERFHVYHKVFHHRETEH